MEVLLKGRHPAHEFIMTGAAMMYTKQTQNDVTLTVQILPVSLTIMNTLVTACGSVCFLTPENGLNPQVCFSLILTVLAYEYNLIAYLSLLQ